MSTSVHDVAAYILDRRGRMPTWKLHKLLYYAQAWHLVWDNVRLFPETIEAWAGGPAVRDMYERHKGTYALSEWEGDAEKLTPSQTGTLTEVLRVYGKMSAGQLTDQSQLDPPWREARRGLHPTERSCRPIESYAMKAYYGSLK